MNNLSKPHIVIIGSGFGGLQAARGLKDAPARVTLVDKNNHHLFQPLLYEVATAALSPADISAPIRWILRKQPNLSVILGEVLRIDSQRRVLCFHDQEMSYDYLILAAGMTHSYFGQNQWARHAPGLKTLSDAIEIRRRVLLAFETAEKCNNPNFRDSLTTFVVIGGGSTGVEMAGALSELTKVSMAEDFRHIEQNKVRVVLVEAGPRLLPAMNEKLSHKAELALEKMGVEVRLSSPVTGIAEDHVMLGEERIEARTVVWAAGIAASPLTSQLGADQDRSGRIKVNPDLTVPGQPNILAIGDLAHIKQANGQPVPGLAPAALQQGRAAAQNLIRIMAGQATEPFVYVDKGTMATIGKAKAVAQVGGMNFSGLPAWLTWLFIHLIFLIGFRNRLLVMIQWAWAYFTSQRPTRLITHPWRYWRPGLPDAQIARLPGCHCQLTGILERVPEKEIQGEEG